jgi:ribosomal protein RSM22 (predicted rRNA methylase)
VARIVAPPRHAKSGITLRACREVGLAETLIASRSRNTYKRARKLDWGDAMEGEDSPV